ncbi:MAG: hypothetical protein AAFU72_05025 [Pseudomonadota bacterium]
MRQALILVALLLAACAEAPPPPPEPPKPIQTTPQAEETIEGSDLAAPAG